MIDMWYGDSHLDADELTVSFSDCDCEYRGNIFKFGKMIGDFAFADSLTLEKAFPQIVFNWD